MSEPAVTHNWGLSRIAVAVRVGSSGKWEPLEIPNNVIVTARNDQEIVDGLEQWNSGYIYKPQRFTFSLDIPVNTNSYKFLRELLLRRITFDLQVMEDKSGAQKNYDGVVNPEYLGLTEELRVCIFDDMSEPFRVGQLPTVTFNAKALRFFTANDPDNPMTVDEEYGSGAYTTTLPSLA